jgi:hypothetical protein
MYRPLQGRCGLYCGECEIYIAYSTNDVNAQQRIARKLSSARGATISSDKIKCLGCKGSASSCWGSTCKIRICAEEKGNEFCYQCRDYPCNEISAFFEKRPAARENLRMISKVGPDAWISAMMSRSQEPGEP